jgi:hypothetical protein
MICLYFTAIHYKSRCPVHVFGISEVTTGVKSLNSQLSVTGLEVILLSSSSSSSSSSSPPPPPSRGKGR